MCRLWKVSYPKYIFYFWLQITSAGPMQKKCNEFYCTILLLSLVVKFLMATTKDPSSNSDTRLGNLFLQIYIWWSFQSSNMAAVTIIDYTGKTHTELLWIHLISLVSIFVDWEKRTFRGIVKFVDCRLKKIQKKGFEILKFMDFHFNFVDFAGRYSTVKCSF